jgi:hypothetical protein
MFKTFFRSSRRTALDLAPHRAQVEFAIVLVKAGSDQQLEYTLKAVAADAEKDGGTVLQITGPLIFVGFSGVIGCAPNSRRQEFVAHTISGYRLFTKIVHGVASALVGTFGNETRMAYTAVLDDFGSLLERLSQLGYGKAVEVEAQAGGPPKCGPPTSSSSSAVGEVNPPAS